MTLDLGTLTHAKNSFISQDANKNQWTAQGVHYYYSILIVSKSVQWAGCIVLGGGGGRGGVHVFQIFFLELLIHCFVNQFENYIT